MQEAPLNLAQILEHAAEVYGEVEIVTRRVGDGSIHRYTYRDALRRSKQCANALRRLGVRCGDRVATMGWNTYQHFEAWYAISGQGAVCHTVNPRLFEQQLEYIINHAEDKILLFDAPFLPLVEKLQDRLPTIEHFVVMTETQQPPDSTLHNLSSYESLIEAESAEFAWPSFPESTVSSLCYTSGTTGNPKGVEYTHRSNLLHAYAINSTNASNVSCCDTVLIVVPMFHANSWGLVYSCPMAGAKVVLPGAQLDGRSIYELLAGEAVTASAAVPTIWNMLLAHLQQEDLSLPDLKEVLIGGSAVPRGMVEVFDSAYDVAVVHGWGMTEMSPLGTICRIKPFMQNWDYARQVDMRVKQGPALFGVSMKIVDEQGAPLPRDGTTCGRLLVKGPWILQRYFKDDQDAVDEEGWFDTGDIATIDEHGFMQITDRAKDLIKSGGEWISSVDLENIVMGHDAVAIAAVIGVAHPTWEERPLLIVQLAEGAAATAADLLEFLQPRVAKWWLPDAVQFVSQIPLTATGKISKRSLREQFADYRLPAADASQEGPT